MPYFIGFAAFTVIGYTIASLLSGKRTGDRPERSLVLRLRNHRVHIHHWIWCLALLILLFALGFMNPLTGVLFGAAVQGLTDRDRLSIVLKG
jgi:hypothetical protein